jgi:xanthosine utilization system XapX-like protein
MLLDLNRQPALNVTLVVTSPRPPFLACGGIVGMLAENPAEKEEYMTMRLISARRAEIAP